MTWFKFSGSGSFRAGFLSLLKFLALAEEIANKQNNCKDLSYSSFYHHSPLHGRWWECFLWWFCQYVCWETLKKCEKCENVKNLPYLLRNTLDQESVREEVVLTFMLYNLDKTDVLKSCPNTMNTLLQSLFSHLTSKFQNSVFAKL